MEWRKIVPEIKLYTKGNLNHLNWPEGSELEKKYFTNLIANGASKYISNVRSTTGILKVNDSVYPVSINSTDYDNAYVCSPYTSYITYAMQEVKKMSLPNLFKSTLIKAIKKSGKGLKKAKINKVICVNNWFLSTNLYPNEINKEIALITDHLKLTHPDHAIMFRSVNHFTNKSLICQLKESGYLMVLARPIYMFTKKPANYMKKKNIKWDMKLINKDNYSLVEHADFNLEDYQRIEFLCQNLYIQKHSECNPCLTKDFISHAHQNNLVNMQGLRHPNGQIDVVVLIFKHHDTLTAPFGGYDTTVGKEKGLYRRLVALLLNTADKEDLTLNASAGAGKFKSIRGGQRHLEYSAIYFSHLPFIRRFAWRALLYTFNNFGKIIMKQQNL